MSKRGQKSSKTKGSDAKYEQRDVVLGKIKGYPPWPGMVVDPESAPAAVQKERPGKKSATIYCVKFFPTADYAWLDPKSISRLQKHEIETFINGPTKRSGELMSAYQTALDPQKWEDELAQGLLASGADDAMDEDEDVEEEDQLDDDDGTGPKKGGAKKRKRAGEPPASAGRAKKAKKAPGKGGRKSKDVVESEDGEGEADGEAEAAAKKKAQKAEESEDPLASDPEAVKVREWRHKLQKAFLSSTKAIPKEEDMPAMDQLFTTIETYENMDIQYLTFSKIGKVMRHIAALTIERAPRDAEFHFRDRAKTLVDKWHVIMNSNNTTAVKSPTEGANGAVVPTTPADAQAPVTNGETASPSAEPNGAVTATPAEAGPVNGQDVNMNTVADQSILTNLGDVTMSEAPAAAA